MEPTHIPEDDFINEKYDTKGSDKATNLLLILSTPRSGSTLLCELLLHNNACIAHEYFQPYEYMPLLAKRWGVRLETKNGFSSFVAKLREHRTLSNGWLGINIHSEHLPIYFTAAPNLKDLKIYFVHILRRDLIAQSVSYHIAAQTGQWSSKFEKRANPSYDYDSIMKKMDRIVKGNLAIQAFLRTRDSNVQTLYYEDMVKNAKNELKRIPCVTAERLSCKTIINQQSTHENALYACQFATKYLKEYSTKAV